MATWFYRVEGIFGDKDVGPLNDAELNLAIQANKLKPGTLVQKDGQWLRAGDLFGEAIEQAAAQALVARTEAKAGAAARRAEELKRAEEEKLQKKLKEFEAQLHESEEKRKLEATSGGTRAKPSANAKPRKDSSMSKGRVSAMSATGGMKPGQIECPFCHQIVYPRHVSLGDSTAQSINCLVIVLLSIVTCGLALLLLFFVPFLDRKKAVICPNCKMQISPR